MNIHGLEKTTLLDYPGKIACTVFTVGCNFRCPYCYNRDLVLGFKGLPPEALAKGGLGRLSEQDFFGFLGRRRGVLDAVVVCGGEPTLQPDLSQFLEKIKSLGFLTKLDTNGSDSATLGSIVEQGLVDYVALDVKAPLEREAYATAVGLNLDDFENRVGLGTILYSIELLVKSDIQFELRTTVVPGLHDKKSLVRLAEQLRRVVPCWSRLVGTAPQAPRQGCDPEEVPWFLQSFEPRTCLDPAFDKVEPFSKAEMKDILAAVMEVIPRVELRGLVE